MKAILLAVVSLGLIANASDDAKEFAYLNGSPGIDGEGLCVFLEDEQGNMIELITTEGALSQWQTMGAMKYASVSEQSLSAIAWVAGLPFIPLVGQVIGGTVGQVVYMGYIFNKGVKEEESRHARLISTLSFFPQSYMAEFMIRDSRFDHLTLDDKRLTFSSNEKGFWGDEYLGFVKLEEMKLRLQEITPKYPQGCDHLID